MIVSLRLILIHVSSSVKMSISYFLGKSDYFDLFVTTAANIYYYLH